MAYTAFIYKITTSGSVYVGSSFNFEQRKQEHKRKLHNENSRGYNLKLYEAIRNNNNQWQMVIIKEFPCENRIELLIEEQKWINELKPDLNCNNSYGLNKERHQEKLKKYRKEKIVCECGCVVNRCGIIKHKKTIKHLDIMLYINGIV